MANGGAGAADPDVIVLDEADLVVLDEEPRDAEPGLAGAGAAAADPVSPVRDASQAADPGSPASDQDREFPRADIAADTGPELTNAGAPGTGPGLTGDEAAAANGPVPPAPRPPPDPG